MTDRNGLRMTAFYQAVLFYLAAAVGLTLVLHQQDLAVVTGVAMGGVDLLYTILSRQLSGLALILPLVVLMGLRRTIIRPGPILSVGLAVFAMQLAFFLGKGSIPALVPFYADPMLAALDRALLLGHDAWELVHRLTPDAVMPWFQAIYASFWLVLAYLLPVIIAATDPDEMRARRHLWLYLGSWVLIGNILALAGSSVGPVYYDQLLGGTRFEALHEAFRQSGYDESLMGKWQAQLWGMSGVEFNFISAFPSMHVAMACMAGVQLWERWRWLGLGGHVFTGAVLWISVYNGYHYLVDGLVSIGGVLVLNRVLAHWIVREVPTALPADAGMQDSAT